MKTGERVLRFGLIGVGGIGAYHRAAIEMLERSGAATLVAVADPTVQQLTAQKAEIEGRGVRWHLDYREMLEREKDLDVVAIATPIPFHFEMALACVQRELYVQMEKPPVPLLGQLEELIRADAAGSVRIGFQMVGALNTQAVKRLITEGRLGEVREIRAGACWPRTDGYYARASWAGRMMLGDRPVFDGPATNALAHIVHNIMYLAGERQDDFAEPGEVMGELYRARRIESYDTACLRGKFGSGIDFSVAVTHATESTLPFRIEVRGTKGWARLSEDGAKLESSCGLPGEQPETTQQLIDRSYEQLNEILRGTGDPVCTTLKDTRGYVSATNAMLASSGGIHDIDPGVIRPYRSENEGGFDVQNLRGAIEENLATGKLFSEQGCSWATASPKLMGMDGFEGLTEEDLARASGPPAAEPS